MVYIGADHRGYHLKEELKKLLAEMGVDFQDMGNAVYDPQDDYPDFAKRVAEAVSKNPARDRGILLCGSAIGVDIVANKHRHVRSGVVAAVEWAQHARARDYVNILSLPADYLSETEAKQITKVWLATEFAGEERDVRRLAKIREIEDSQFSN